MRKFFYRLTWDREFRNKTLIIAGSTVCFLAVCVFAFPICSRVIAELSAVDEEEIEEVVEEGDKFFLDFGKRIKNKDSDSESDSNAGREEHNGSSEQSSSTTQNNSSNEQNSSGGGSSSGGSSSGGGSVEHVHSWHTVIDSAAWTETIKQQTGCSYRCNQCGFVTTSSSTISSHCSQHSHTFSSTPIYEERQVYHAGSSHEECSCGARR